MVIAALCTIARTWKKPRWPSTDEWIKKYTHTHTHTHTHIYIYITESLYCTPGTNKTLMNYTLV